ncbi:MAG: SDR family oxidoreductase [Pedobacter sp.]|nr:MAG: SDR family oxidoreductase [Pedobacter sp.]
MELSLNEKTAIVTGASQGIGRAIVKQLAAEGVRVLAVGRNEALLQSLVAEISDTNGQLPVIMVQDLNDPRSVRAITDNALEAFGKIDILINNAGKSQPLNIIDEHEKFRESLLLELERPKQLTESVLSHFVNNRQGVILNVISTYELKSINSSAIAKAALVTWSKQLSAQVGKYGIRVNCLQPGLIDTENTRRIFSAAERKEFARREIPLGDFGKPEDMAGIATFLVSPMANYMTGSVITVDGGLRYHPF